MVAGSLSSCWHTMSNTRFMFARRAKIAEGKVGEVERGADDDMR